MKFSILFFIIFCIKVRMCDAVINTVKIGDPFTCSCRIFWQREISWILHKVNGEEIPLVTKCPYPYKNCTIQYHEGDIILEVNNYRNKLTVQHVMQDMFRLICSPEFRAFSVDSCLLNVVDRSGASSIGSPIHTLNQGDQFTCDCKLFGSSRLEWTLEKVDGEKIILLWPCEEPYTSCVTWYDRTNFIIVTEDKNTYMQKYSSIPPMFVSKLTVKHVDIDMLRVFCSRNGVWSKRDQCLMNVVEYVRPDNGTSKSTATYSAKYPSQTPSTTQSPDVYLTTYPTLSFLTTTFQFLFSTTPKPATENYANNHEKSSSVAMVICVTALPPIGAIGIPVLVICCCYRMKKRKDLQRQNEAMRDISNTPQLTPASAPGPDQNDLYSTHVNPLVHPINNTQTTESQQHTTIQNTAQKDSPPSYSSLFQLRVEPPPYTTLIAESYNCESAQSQQSHNVPPPYSTSYNCLPPSAQQQAPNEPPPPYSVWHTS